MASRVVSYDLEDGHVEIEVQGEVPHGIERASIGGRTVERAQVAFAEAVAVARDVADTLHASFARAASRPDEVELEFGLKLSGSSGVVVSAASIEASLRVKCTWRALKD